MRGKLERGWGEETRQDLPAWEEGCQARASKSEEATEKQKRASRLSQKEAWDEGRNEGEQIGLAKGLAKGELVALRRMLQRQVEKKHPALVEERKEVERLDSAEACEALLDTLLESDSAALFQEKLKALLPPNKAG